MYNLYRLHQSPMNSFAFSNLLPPSCWLYMPPVTQNIGTCTYDNLFFVCYWYCIIVIFYADVSKLDCVSPTWNNITAIDANNVAALCFTRFSPSHSWQLFLCTSAYNVTYFTSWKASIWSSLLILILQGKFCIFFIENISLRVQSCTRNFIQFSIACKFTISVDVLQLQIYYAVT